MIQTTVATEEDHLRRVVDLYTITTAKAVGLQVEPTVTAIVFNGIENEVIYASSLPSGTELTFDMPKARLHNLLAGCQPRFF